MTIYTGYIYLWYDTKARLFYLGGHKGKVQDSYVCSNKIMLRAYKKRPETFRFKVLEYINGDNIALREAEQRWLNMIDDSELYWTPNIYNKTVRYYNQKKHSSGGNGSANKGNSNIGGWNKGKTMNNINGNARIWKITELGGEVHYVERSNIFCRDKGLRWSTLYLSWKNDRPLKRGACAGYKVELVDSVSKLN